MSRSAPRQLIAVGVGNTSVRFGWFEETADRPLRPSRQLRLDAHDMDLDSLGHWLPDGNKPWYFSSVYRTADERLRHWVANRYAGARTRCLVAQDFPISLDVEYPDRVGADRLAAASAANCLRAADRAAIVVDAGTAINVDVLDRRGIFLGGAILPGQDMAARALCESTDLLPLVAVTDATPKAIGRCTKAAIQSGVYWSAVGAVSAIVERIRCELDEPFDLFLTGGGARKLAVEIGQAVHLEDDLVLSGTALAATSCKWPL